MKSFRVPAADRVLRHDYPVNAVWRALFRLRPECVIVSGWSTFASQAAIVWCRLRQIPYLLVVESHDRDTRPGWRRALKTVVVPRVVKAAAGVLVAGSLARESMIRRGADPARIRIFANTVDVHALGERADRLAQERLALRKSLGLVDADLAVLSVARLAPEKGLTTLVRAIADAEDPRLVLVIAGSGPEGDRLRSLADELGIRLVLLGDVDWADIAEVYVAADIFALLSDSEPWGVVVNEAAACGLPLVLSDAVGAGYDLLVDHVNGRRVPAGDSHAASAALKELAGDPPRRIAFGAASRARVAGWGYDESVQGLVELVELALARKI
jgi:glycosyltransferase involved in cell wall biosynthesis